MSSNDINLTAAIRQSLITLQSTQTLTNQTQNDLSTGLKVNNAIDNPVAFFQAASLSDRASDFSNKKDTINQAVSSLSTALEGITGIESVVSQLQGLVLSAESASSQQISGLVSQYNSLRTQLNDLATDTSYQGLNLIAGTGQVLTVSFSDLTSSNLTVNSVDVTTGPSGLAIAQAVTANGTGFQVDYNSLTGADLNTVSGQTFYFAGTAQQLTSGTNYTFSYGSTTLTITVGSAGALSSSLTSTQTLADAQQLTFEYNSQGLSAAIYTGNPVTVGVFYDNGVVGSAGSTIVIDIAPQTSSTLAAGTYTFSYGTNTLSFNVATAGGTSGTFTTTQTFSNTGLVTVTLEGSTFANASASDVVTFGTYPTSGTYVNAAGALAGQVAVIGSVAATTAGVVTLGAITGEYVLDARLPDADALVVNSLQDNLLTLRTQAQTIGSNVALLTTRLDFTTNYINLLTQGAGKLTLADLNEEGANLLSLQTQQQLGIQALSFAGQNERAVLSLFR